MRYSPLNANDDNSRMIRVCINHWPTKLSPMVEKLYQPIGDYYESFLCFIHNTNIVMLF
ncbi:hypothetical protein ACMAZF_07905 [Psychrobium sp. nBUS_13]|uniref:hypothetical protein n=1 Tax=Psychrobium sp. nBUS_13 TaxID=3395319 RepID=UPI003EC0A483